MFGVPKFQSEHIHCTLPALFSAKQLKHPLTTNSVSHFSGKSLLRYKNQKVRDWPMYGPEHSAAGTMT
jgi:hypothetical protein